MKVIQNILESNYENGKWKLKSKKEIYKRIERIGNTMRKKRIIFYGHLRKVDANRATKQLFNFFE